MSLPLAISYEAREDVDAAYLWYEAQQAGRGDEFYAEFRGQAEQVRQAPEVYGRGLRRSPLCPVSVLEIHPLLPDRGGANPGRRGPA